MNRLSRVLYRSILRWTYTKAVKRIPFNIIMETHGPKFYNHIATTLQPKPKSLEDVRFIIASAFRSMPSSDSNLDKAFDVLKALNSTSSNLKSLLADHELHSRPDVLAHAPFRVGNVVRIVENGVSLRGVVRDWTVDLTTKKQSVSIILDSIDYNEHSSELLQLRSPDITLDSSKVYHETRANLKRICNENLHHNFIFYDEWYKAPPLQMTSPPPSNGPSLGCYVPNQTLLYRYPLDYVSSSSSSLAHNTETDNDNDNGNDNQILSSSLLEHSSVMSNVQAKAELNATKGIVDMGDMGISETQTLTSQQQQQQQSGGWDKIRESSLHVLTTTQSIGKRLDEIIRRNKNSASTTASKKLSDDLKVSSVEVDDANVHAHTGKTKQSPNPVLDDIQYLISSLVQSPGSTNSSSSSSSSAAASSSSVSHSEFQNLVQNHAFPLSHILHPSHTFQDTYHALKTLTELYLTVDQLLQLRFQRFGISYIDNLNPSSVKATLLHQTQTQSASSSDNSKVSQNDDETYRSSLPISPIVRNLDSETAFPTATFSIGQICKHTKYGYKCVITGYDQRPLMDVSGWEAVKGSKYGKEQPFYRCIPDERDVEEWLGQGAFRTSFYVAQENLIPYYSLPLSPPSVPPPSPSSSASSTSQNNFSSDDTLSLKRKELNLASPLRHRDISMYFDRYDSHTKRYVAAKKLRFCFPSTPSSSPPPSSSPSSNRNEDGSYHKRGVEKQEEEGDGEEDEFMKCEALLVEIHQALKQSLNRTREEYLKQYSITPQNQEIDKTSTHPHPQPDPLSNLSPNPNPNPNSNSDSIPSLSMDHLLKILKHATNRDDAKITDALISLIGMSHTDTQINKLIRSAMSEQKRGSYAKAFEYLQVASAIDPTFAEAHYRQACLNQKAREFNEAIRRFKIALSLFPHHYGSLAGLGSVYENRSNVNSAKSALSASLDIHPWQEYVPTLLTLVYNAEDAMNNNANANANANSNAEASANEGNDKVTSSSSDTNDVQNPKNTQ